MLSSMVNPAQILNIFSIPFFYLKRELTVGAVSDVKGALQRYPKVDKTLWNFLKSVYPSCFHQILSNISVIRIKSIIIGAANKESSQTLYVEITFFPPKKISETYSSIAFFESPVLGQYLITTVWSISAFLPYNVWLELRISVTQDDLEVSFDLNYSAEAKFFPSLFPKWL